MSDPTPVVPAAPESTPQQNNQPVPAPASVAPPAAPVAVPPKPESATFLELQRKEREHRKSVEASKKATEGERAELDKQKAEVAARLAQAEALERKINSLKGSNALEAMKALGYDEDKIAQAILEGQTPEQLVKDSTATLREDLEKEIEAKLEAKLAAEREKNLKATQEQVIAEWSKETVQLISDAKTEDGKIKYPLLKAMGLEQQIVDEIKEVYFEQGIDVPWEEAAKNAEAHYTALLKKAQAALEPTPPKPAVTPEVKAAEEGGSTEKLAIKEREATYKVRREEKPVITNNMTPTSSAPVSGNDAWEQIKKQVLEKHGLK